MLNMYLLVATLLWIMFYLVVELYFERQRNKIYQDYVDTVSIIVSELKTMINEGRGKNNG